MSKQQTMNYIKKRLGELSMYMSNIRDPHEVQKVFSKYIKFYALLEILKEEEEW